MGLFRSGHNSDPDKDYSSQLTTRTDSATGKVELTRVDKIVDNQDGTHQHQVETINYASGAVSMEVVRDSKGNVDHPNDTEKYPWMSSSPENTTPPSSSPEEEEN